MSISKIQKKAIEYYKQWMKEKTFSTLLNTEVFITRKGLDHILSGSKSRKRKLLDKVNKLMLLKYAKVVIKESNKLKIQKINNTNYYILEKAFDKYLLIRVILKKDNKGRYYFYSVMKTKNRLSQV